MKTLPSVLKFAAVGSGLVLAALLVNTASAGPGAQFWQQRRSTRAPAPAAVQPVVTAAPACPGSRIVPVTSFRPVWPNARGPRLATPAATKVVCNSCPVTSVVATNAWRNHRGPSNVSTVTRIGPDHDCGSGCGTAAAN